MQRIGYYEFIKNNVTFLGSGSFSVVYLGEYIGKDNKYIKNKTKVAIKIIKTDKMTNKALDILDMEINIMGLIKENPHPNIVGCYDIIRKKNETYLILEYCDSGDLKNIMQKPIKEKFVQFYFTQLANGLKYLDKHSILHRDIKPRNILLTNNKKQLKIADFGFAKKETHNPSLYDTICGSPLYMAPEIITNKPYNNQIDLWSIGMILYELLFGSHPFEYCKNIQELKDNIYTNIEIPPKDTINKDISNECIDLLKRLLQPSADSRITWNEFFESPWLQTIKAQQILQTKSSPLAINQSPSSSPLQTNQLLFGNTPPNNHSVLKTSEMIVINEYYPEPDQASIHNTDDDCLFEMELDDNKLSSDQKKIKVIKIIDRSSVLNISDNKYDIVDM